MGSTAVDVDDSSEGNVTEGVGAVDAVAVDGFHFDDSGKCRLSSCWSGGHIRGGLGSVGMVKGAGIVFAEPRVFKGVGAVDFVHVGEEEPKVMERFIRDELELGKGVWVGSRASEVGDQWWSGDWIRLPCWSSGVVETGWHC
jgi:hypothetical protein